MYTMYKNTFFTPIEKTSDIRVSPPPIKPSFGSKSNKRPADEPLQNPKIKK